MMSRSSDTFWRQRPDESAHKVDVKKFVVWEVYHPLLPSSPSPSHQLTRFRPIHTSSSKLRPESSSSSSEAATAVPSQSTSVHSKFHQCVPSAEGLQSSVTEVPLVPGTFFRLAAGKSAVRVEHLAGWNDTATLQGQPAGGGSWRAVPIDTGSVISSTLASVRQVYEVRQGVDGSKSGIAAAAAAVAVTTSPSDGAPGLLQLTTPEKWISLDVRTSGSPVAVSKIVEADLRVATGGAAVTLGSVRGLQIDIDTSVSRLGGGNGHTHICADTAGSHDLVGDNCGGGGGSGTASGSGAVTASEVSGTSISIVAAGTINVRRLVGGTMNLTANLELLKTPSLPSGNVSREAVTAAAVKQGIELGAVYGGLLQISTGGGSVRVGTLDCGAARMGQPSDTSATNPAELGSVNDSGSGGVNDSGSGSGSDADADTNAFILPSTTGGGDRDVSARSSGSGGADILSHGGAVVLDGVEGDVYVDSGGGRIKVLIQAGLRSARLVSGGGPVDVALAPGVALRLLEVRGAAEVEVQTDLQHHLERVPQAQQSRAVSVRSFGGSGEGSVAIGDGGNSNTSGGNSSSGSSSGISGVWVARVVPEPEGG
ncbi:hypothetical protein Vafri_21063, partial [Volvox africanus]